MTPLDEEDGPRMFYLVESRDGPPHGQRFKMKLRDDETFETDFIGATPEECQRWADERRRHDLSFHDGIIAIIDARSAKDGTLLMQIYVQHNFPFGGYGLLPQEKNVWYNFRVYPRQAAKAEVALLHVSPEVSYPFWYGNKERFTDENGVFDVEEADRYSIGVDPDVTESEIFQRKFQPLLEGVSCSGE